MSYGAKYTAVYFSMLFINVVLLGFIVGKHFEPINYHLSYSIFSGSLSSSFLFGLLGLVGVSEKMDKSMYEISSAVLVIGWLVTNLFLTLVIYVK